MKKPFDNVYKKYDSFMKFWKLYRTDLIIGMLGLCGCENICDVGGGTGYLAERLSSHCSKVYVVDESAGMLSLVNADEKVIPVKTDALQTGFADNTFDVVILSDVYHHIKESDLLILEVKRILKPGGILLIHDFDLKKLRTKILRVFEARLFGELYYCTAAQIRQKLSGYGFSELNTLIKGNYFIITWRKA
ncbi:MAG: class I SAM-dependent methyltransferase [Bacillota bacterium]